MADLFDYTQLVISRDYSSDITNGDRHSIIIKSDDVTCVGCLISLISEDRVNYLEPMKNAHLCIVTAIECNEALKRGYCVMHFSIITHVMPRSLYEKLVRLSNENEKLKDQHAKLLDEKMDKVA